MARNNAPLRRTPFAEFTPERARKLVAKLSPRVRAGLVERVRPALQFHHEEGHADAARFCIVVLDALRNNAVDSPPPAT